MRTQKSVNEALGCEEDGLPGMIIGAGQAGFTGIGAGIVGGGEAAYRWASGLFD